MVKMSKMAEIWGFAPYSGAKNAKNGGFLRVCGRKMVGGAIKIPFLGVGNTKKPPGWAVFVSSPLDTVRYIHMCRCHRYTIRPPARTLCNPPRDLTPNTIPPCRPKLCHWGTSLQL